MIKLKNLTKYFDKKIIFEKVDLEVMAGEFLAVIGASGCGKSTLLRLLLGIQKPNSGSVQVNGLEVATLNDESLSKIRQKMGMVFQFGALFDSLSIYENVAFPLREHLKLTEGQIEKKVIEKLELVELRGVEKAMPSELSGGMQKRVGIARAIVSDPSIILYDEPTTGLDPITSVIIEDLMVKLAKEQQATSIVVTHVMQTVARTAKRVVMMHEGKIIEIGPTEQVKLTKNPIVRKFVTGGLGQ